MAMGIVHGVREIMHVAKSSSKVAKSSSQELSTHVKDLLGESKNLDDPLRQIDVLRNASGTKSLSAEELVNNSNKLESVQSLKNQNLSEFIDDTSRAEYLNVIKEDRNSIYEKYLNKLDNAEDVIDIAQDIGEEILDDRGKVTTKVSKFYNYIKVNWLARFYRVNQEFSSPRAEEKFVLTCKTSFSTFNFIFLMEKESYKVLLTHHKIIDILTQTDLYKDLKPLKNQELLVLNDENEFFLFSITRSKSMEFPQHYFAILKDGYFMHRYHSYGQISPEHYISRYKNGQIKSDGFCKLVK